MGIFKRLVRDNATPIERGSVPIPVAAFDPNYRLQFVAPMHLSNEVIEDFHGNMPVLQNLHLPAAMHEDAPPVYTPREYHHTRPGANVYDIDGMLPAGEGL